MNATRLVALLTAVVGVFLLGHALYTLVQYGEAASASLALGLVFAAISIVIRRRAPRG